MKILIISLVLILQVLLLSACGMRGDLYLPDDKSAANETAQNTKKDS